MTAYRVGVIGGSLGGLHAACLLRDDGHDVTVFERATSNLQERGAGIGLLPATARYPVERAGADLNRISVATDHIRYLHRDGSVAVDLDHRYLFSSWNTVYRCMAEAFDDDRYLLDHELVDFDQRDGAVEARFANGHRFRGDLLVAADGIGSLVRSRLQPKAEIRFAGYVAWRGMVPEAELPDDVAGPLGQAISYYVYANSHILVYPIPNADGDVEPGRRLINFVWYRNYLDGGDLNDLLTDRWGAGRDLSVPPGAVADHHVTELRATAAARLPPQLATIVAAVEEPFLQVIYDVEVERLTFGRICLVGDAGFAVRPHAAAGTAKAADDAWSLAAALVPPSGSATATAADVEAALRAWEPGRIELGRNLLERTRRIGGHSQLENDWDPNDADNLFGLHRPDE